MVTCDKVVGMQEAITYSNHLHPHLPFQKFIIWTKMSSLILVCNSDSWLSIMLHMRSRVDPIVALLGNTLITMTSMNVS